MKPSRSKHTKRQRLAVCVAAATTSIAALQHHVHVVLSDPSTWTLPLHHKCGWAALLGVGWMFLELANMAAATLLESLLLPAKA